MRDRGLRHWLPTYLLQSLQRQKANRRRRQGVTHLLFSVCDHFEPRHGANDFATAERRIQTWHTGFREMQEECERKYGLRPLHTWFYPPHHGEEHLAPLARMAFDGLGEVELHYHHENDTRETLRASLEQVLARYHEAGLLLQNGTPPESRFGFIHGNWALDNSADGRFCGVNGELSVLKSLGCWADLTMPSANECQTRKINSIYYATDSEARAKSHNWGSDARVGQISQEGLLLIQGPLALGLRGGFRPTMENASLTTENWGDAYRIRSWIRCGVHVVNRPEWVFIKLHAHGALERDFDALFGRRAREMHRILAEEYNDGRHFQLHYVTARQAFNLVRAAEHGAEGNPNDFLNWEIPPPVTSRYWMNTRHHTKACTHEQLLLESLDPSKEALLMLRGFAVTRITGKLEMIDLTPQEAFLRLPPDANPPVIRIQCVPGFDLQVRGASVTELKGSELELIGNSNETVHIRFIRGPVERIGQVVS